LALSLCTLQLALPGAPARAAPASAGHYFSRGNDEYEAGRYDRALALYDSAAAQFRSADAYYNRGNAHFRLGSTGRAIADYTRAWVLRPADRQIRHNLAFARQYRPDKALVIENPIVRGVAGLLRLFDVGAARVLCGVFFLLALVLLASFLTRGQRPLLWGSVGLGAVFLYFLVSSLGWGAVLSPGRAVVVVPELTLRAGPGAEYKDIVVVHDGLEVAVRERRPGWALIQIPGGAGGWVETATVEPVFGR
jgi:uncharacterized protein YgiM (DUF1202 family)